MEIYDVAAARVQRGGHDRLSVRLDDAEVRDQRLVEDRVDHVAVVAAAFALAPQTHAVGRRLGHGATVGCGGGHNAPFNL